MIEPMSLAALIAGANGLEIEVHIDPPSALSDKDQQLTVGQFEILMKKLELTRAFMATLNDVDTLGAKDSVSGDTPRIDGEMKAFADAVD